MTPSAKERTLSSRRWLFALLAFAFLLSLVTVAFLHTHPANHAPAQLP